MLFIEDFVLTQCKMRNCNIIYAQLYYGSKLTCTIMSYHVPVYYRNISMVVNILRITFNNIVFFIATLFARLYVRVNILLTDGKDWHNCIISLRLEGISSLTPSLFIEMSGPNQVSHVFVCEGYFPSFYDFSIGFWNSSDSVGLLFFFILCYIINLFSNL